MSSNKHICFFVLFSIVLFSIDLNGQYCSGTTYLNQSTGTFEDGSGTSDYMNNSDCKWIIQPSNATSITLSFSFMDLSGADFVKVYDGNSVWDPILATYDGSAPNPPIGSIISTGGTMLIHFSTNSSYPDPGWTANYTSTSTPSSYCNGTQTLYNTTGSFNDGSGVNNYLSNTQCNWLISPGTNKIIHLNFTSFNTESGFDEVNIYDGQNSLAPLLGTYSGTNIPPTINSSSGALFITFESDNMVEADGWSATYYTTTQTQYCSGTNTLTNASGSFTDGSSSSDIYSSNTYCNWLIQPPNAANIQLSFNYFNTEQYYDELKIYDGASASANLIGTYSGNTLPPIIQSSGPSLYLRFTSDNYINNYGWSASYSSNTNTYCSGTTNLYGAIGNISDGSPNNIDYANNSDCYWIISPPGATSIDLNLNYFQTESGYDFLNIYDGNSTSSNLLYSLSGSSFPSLIQSTNGEVLLHFTSDNASTDLGWDLDYSANYSTSNPYCSGTTNLSASQGLVEDGSGVNLYENNSNCSWLIAPPGAIYLELDFDYIELEQNNDWVHVYDGSSTSDPLLGSFTGSVQNVLIQSSSGEVLVHFTSDASTKSDGWEFEYESFYLPPDYCNDTLMYTNQIDTFEDGSENFNYNNNTSCFWLIEADPGNEIALDFNYFDIEKNRDFLHIYDGRTENDNLIISLSGQSVPYTITSTSNFMLLHFETDENNRYDGWEATYTIGDYLNIQDYTKNISIEEDYHSVRILMELGKLADVKVYNNLGQLVKIVNVQNGLIFIDKSKLANGFYTLHIYCKYQRIKTYRMSVIQSY